MYFSLNKIYILTRGGKMDITTYVKKGILILNFSGVFDNNSYSKFNEEIDYLLYNQGMSFYAFNFKNVDKIEEDTLTKIQSKLIEIFLNCGQVIMCGLNKLYQEKIGKEKTRLYYVSDEREIYNLITI